MKKTFALSLFVGSSVSSHAALYTQDFTTDPGFLRPNEDNNGTVDNGPNSVRFRYADTDAGDLEEQTVTPGLFFGGTQTGAGEGVLVSTTGGSLISNGTHAGDRGRGFGVIIDTSAATAGNFTVSFDLSNLTLPNGGAATEEAIGFSLYEGSGVTGGVANYAAINMGRNNSNGNPLTGLLTGQGTATTSQIGSPTNLTANGQFSQTFALSEAGSTGDYLMLQWWVWSESTEPITTDLPSFEMDNIVVDTVPEPSSLFLFGLGGLGFLSRRSR